MCYLFVVFFIKGTVFVSAKTNPLLGYVKEFFEKSEEANEKYQTWIQDMWKIQQENEKKMMETFTAGITAGFQSIALMFMPMFSIPSSFPNQMPNQASASPMFFKCHPHFQIKHPQHSLQCLLHLSATKLPSLFHQQG